jgi:signal transduction histidine kinase/CheY-like chemotaxis protein
MEQGATPSYIYALSRFAGILHLLVSSVLKRVELLFTFVDTVRGPSRVAIYNAAFEPLVGKAHPALMGRTFEQGFPEIWDNIRPVFSKAEESGLAVEVREIPLIVERNNYVEESYFSGNVNPLRGDSGKIEGFYNAVHEITNQMINDRRIAMMSHMQIPSSLDHGRLAEHVIPSFETNPLDIPVALLYKSDEETVPGSCLLLLRGSVGVPDRHPLATKQVDFNSSKGIAPLLRKARRQIITVPVDDIFNGIQWRGYEEPSKFVSILPILAPERLFGFLVVGANPRRAIDEHHHQFMRDLASKVSSMAAFIISAEENQKRADRIERELAESERQIRYMAQNASVGMQHLSIDGTTIWANECYYNLTGHPRPDKDQYKLSFIDVFLEEDQTKALDAWSSLVEGKPNLSVELRLKRMFTPPSGEPQPACLLALSFPYIETGKVKSIMIFSTDISALKWAESSEARNAQDARDAKRQQEEFIDIVSHEMRNPLSAIFQCADLISSSLDEVRSKGASRDVLLEALESNVKAAKTINTLANHQKRIIDDVLTLSKLEHMMLSISPRPTQLSNLVDLSVQMFQTDLLSHNIEVTVAAEPSLHDNHVDWVLVDPSRVTQIFINLLTNAIKFTRGQPRREIMIQYGAVLSDPRQAFSNDIHWAPTHQIIDDLTLNPEWGTGEDLYLTLAVRDSGVGMSAEEIRKLFSRFEQASAKTTIRYGGSGLGLFISQRLSEKQGGEIGVVSEPGRGSTFAFYVKARRTDSAGEVHETPVQIHHPQRPIRSITSPLDTGISADKNLTKMHVLLVEDNIVNQRVLRQVLEKAGCLVYVANHGVEALQMLKESDVWHEKPKVSKHLDIILMDWEMPVMDGLTCSREIRALEQVSKITRHVEIIAITANAREEQIQSALASGIVS